MINVRGLTFNAFQENTYIVWTSNLECMIIDPGCSNDAENQMLRKFIGDKGIKPVRLINTHCHIDHVLGNRFIAKEYGLKLEAHKNEVPILQSGDMVSKMYGIPFSGSPDIEIFIEEDTDIKLGDASFRVLFTPGHSPGSLCFYNQSSGILIGGDVLFKESIGRTDLPGGSYQTLIDSIVHKLFVLPDETIVYPGHGPETSIGYERKNNPFLNT